MCIWKVGKEDRLCEYCSYEGGCEERAFKGVLLWDARARLYVSKMSQICGCDIITRVKRNRVVWARNIVAYQMRRDGYTLMHIADAIRRDHATVVHAEKQVECMLKCPKFYREEYAIWQEFQEAIKSTKDNDYVEENSEMVVLPGSESGGAQG